MDKWEAQISLDELLKDKDCKTNLRPRLVGGWCGDLISEMRITGAPAFVFSNRDTENPDITSWFILFASGKRKYSIEFHAPKEQFEGFAPYFEVITSNFNVK